MNILTGTMIRKSHRHSDHWLTTTTSDRIGSGGGSSSLQKDEKDLDLCFAFGSVGETSDGLKYEKMWGFPRGPGDQAPTTRGGRFAPSRRASRTSYHL